MPLLSFLTNKEDANYDIALTLTWETKSSPLMYKKAERIISSIWLNVVWTPRKNTIALQEKLISRKKVSEAYMQAPWKGTKAPTRCSEKCGKTLTWNCCGGNGIVRNQKKITKKPYMYRYNTISKTEDEGGF
ncbi:uncharacterized protein LOC144304981 isoform X3 [Canis aureus]